MPLQNRVLPTGDIVAIPERGTMTGNRGILHGPDRVLGPARWRHKAWICCTLDWQGRRRRVMTGRNWTELFFHDEAVAMAAGHRPCAYCRRADYNRFCDAWERAFGRRQKAPEMDRILHAARVRRDRSQVTHDAACADLADGTFVLHDGVPHLIWQGALHAYSPGGYADACGKAVDRIVPVLTPAPLVAVLGAGYAPFVAGVPQYQGLP